MLYTAQGEIAGIYSVVTVGASESLGVVTQFQRGYYAHDVRSGDITGYFDQIVQGSGFANFTFANLIMIVIGLLFLWLAISKDYEPLLLVPIGFGILVGNVPLPLSIFNSVSVYMIDPVSHEYVFNTGSNSVMGMIYFGVRSGIFPPLIFLGIGAMTDFAALLSNPKSLLLGAAAQIGIFITFLGALALVSRRRAPRRSASSAAPTADGHLHRQPTRAGAHWPDCHRRLQLHGDGADHPAAHHEAAHDARGAADSHEARAQGLALRAGGLPHRRHAGDVHRRAGRPAAARPLFFGNLLKESGVTGRLAKTAANAMLDTCTILLGLAVGASTSAQAFLNPRSVMIFALGCVAFGTATAGGVIFAKVMNVFSTEKVNPLIGAAGVSAGTRLGARGPHGGPGRRPDQLPAPARDGPERRRRDRSAIAAGVFLGLF